MRTDRDGSLDGRLNMSNHRISGLTDPTEADDAVTRRYVASRFQALSDEVQGNKSKLGAFLNLLGVVNNQVLIRVYELIDTDIRFASHFGGVPLFRKYPLEPSEMDEFEFFICLHLKKILCHIY